MADCKKCSSQFETREADLEFYKKFDAPSPEMCPNCRLQHKLNFRNERTFYRRESSLSGQGIVSIYDKGTDFPVYSQEEWWSDKWDGLDYGRDFDFERPFFEQFKELMKDVPRIALFNVNPVNSNYCQQAYDNKNSYLCCVVEECEDCMYMDHSNCIKDSFDSSFMQHSELCYDCVDSEKLYSCIGCQSCQNSSSLIFCYDCVGCQDCVGCFGIRNKKYCVMNEQYSKEDYEEKVRVLELSKHSKFMNARDFFLGWIKDLPHRVNRNFNCEDSDGNYLINAQRAHECFNAYEIQDCAYCTWIFNSHDCFDVYGMGYSEWVLECLGVEKLNNCAYCTFVSHGGDCFYSDICFNSNSLFGCVGLRGKKHCVFNKQYSEIEYEKLKARIIEHMKKTGEWGEFFPAEMSPFAYNETAAADYFPLDKEGVKKSGFMFKEVDAKEYASQSHEFEDDSLETEEAVCDEVLACTDCGKNYKILPRELKYYKKMKIPLPRKGPDCRYKDRLALRNSRDMQKKNCDKCKKEMMAGHYKNAGVKIYCEECYRGFLG